MNTDAFGFTMFRGNFEVYQGINPRRVIWKVNPNDDDAIEKARWLAGQLNKRQLSVQATLASYKSRQGRRRALRRLALQILREYESE